MLNELIKIMVTKDIWSAVADNKVDALLSSKDLINLFHGLLSCDITLNHGCTFDRSHLKEVNRDEMRLAEQVNAILSQSICDDLCPTAWRGAQINHF